MKSWLAMRERRVISDLSQDIGDITCLRQDIEDIAAQVCGGRVGRRIRSRFRCSARYAPPSRRLSVSLGS